MKNDYLADVAAKLTYLGAINLRDSHRRPCPLNPNAIHGRGSTYLGHGKWTTIGAMAVERNLIKAGAAEMRLASGWSHTRAVRTPLGVELAAYLDAHWDQLTFPKGKQF